MGYVYFVCFVALYIAHSILNCCMIRVCFVWRFNHHRIYGPKFVYTIPNYSICSLCHMWQSILITHSPLSVNWALYALATTLLDIMYTHNNNILLYLVYRRTHCVLYEYIGRILDSTLNTIMFLLVCNIYYCLSSAVIILTLFICL